MSDERDQADGVVESCTLGAAPRVFPAGTSIIGNADGSFLAGIGLRTLEPSTPAELGKGGVKYDTGKPQWYLLPLKALEGVVRVLMYGAAKYAAWNWRKGMRWTRVYDAAQRHLVAWAECEDLDTETQLNHIDHALCELIFLREFIRTNTGTDDRYRAGTA